VGYGSFSYSGNRSFNNGSFLAKTSASSAYNANSTTVALNGEVEIKLGSKSSSISPRLKPFLGIAWANHSQNGFTEQGSGYLLNVSGNTAASLLGTVGVKLDYPIILSRKSGRVLTPSLSLAYQGDALANSTSTRSLNASLVSVPNSSTLITGQNPGPNNLAVDLGADLKIGNNVSVYASTLYRVSTNGDQFNYGGGLRVVF
jgi:uncharacterized protein with beta-barrel porin domain